jgi:hypothetical protein
VHLSSSTAGSRGSDSQRSWPLTGSFSSLPISELHHAVFSSCTPSLLLLFSHSQTVIRELPHAPQRCHMCPLCLLHLAEPSAMGRPRDLFCLEKKCWILWILTCRLLLGVQPVFPGQCLDMLESLSHTFIHDLQGDLNKWPIPTAHHSPPGPFSLSYNILLAGNVLVCYSANQPPFPPIYDGPNLVTERFLCSYKLQVENRQEIIPTLCLKSKNLPHPTDVVVTKPPFHRHPPSVDDSIFVAKNFATLACFPRCFMFRCPPHCKQNPIYVFPERKLRGLLSNFHILVYVSNLYIP